MTVILCMLVYTGMYCVKCMTKTGTKNVTSKIAKSGRVYQIGDCIVCGKQKSTFVRLGVTRGRGVLGKALDLPNGKVPILGDIPMIGGLF